MINTDNILLYSEKKRQLKWFWMPFCVSFKVRESKETMQTFKMIVLSHDNQSCLKVILRRNNSSQQTQVMTALCNQARSERPLSHGWNHQWATFKVFQIQSPALERSGSDAHSSTVMARKGFVTCMRSTLLTWPSWKHIDPLGRLYGPT